MKSFRYILAISLGFLLISTESSAQVSTMIKGVRKGITEIVKKKAGKEAAEKAVKEGAEAVLERGAKSAVKNRVEKDAAGRVVINGVEALGKREAKQVLKEGSESAATMALRKATGKTVAVASTSYASKKFVTKTISKEATEGFLKVSLKEAEHVAARKLTREAAEEVSEQLTKRLGRSTMEQWRRLVPDATADANRILLKDLNESSNFRRLICGSLGKKGSPQLLEVYTHALDAPTMRTRPDVLRYLSNGADLYNSKGVYKKSLYGVGKDLRLVERNGVVQIYKEGSEKSIGKIVPNSSKGFNIEVPFEDRTLLNLYPMNNSTYTTTRTLGKRGYVKNTWVTDEFGRTKEVITEIKPDGKFTPIKRDKNAIQSVGRIKKDNTIHGQTPNRKTYINDDSGHMAALQCGGTNDSINLLSQNSSLNKGAWKSGEDAARKSINRGRAVTRRVKIDYPDKVDLRPSAFTVNQNVDGVNTIVEQVFQNVIDPVI